MVTTKMTKIGVAVASSLMFVSLAHAAQPGAYAGIGLGASNINAASKSMFQNTTDSSSTAKRQQGGLGGKLFGGYNFNQNFGLEANVAEYAPSTNKMTVDSSTASAKYKMTAISLVAKGYLPIQNDFDLYALGGGAEVYSKVNYSNNSNGAITTNSNLTTGNHTTRKLRPVIGVGADYNINSHVVTGLEFSHIQGIGNTNTSASAIPSANMLTLTAAYKFD